MHSKPQPGFSRLSGIYVHLPFCRSICPFCGFPVLRDRQDKRERYLDYLEKELDVLDRTLRFDSQKLRSVYFGGGTPSRFDSDQLNRIIELIAGRFAPSSETQWSIEINPEDVTRPFAETLRHIGFNRVSIGIQSFDQNSLERLGRLHSAAQAHNAIELLQRAGFRNINLDLLFGYPGQSLNGFQKDLDRLVRYAPTHVSVYCLGIEPKTKINRLNSWKQWQERNENLVSTMYRFAVQYLEKHGIIQYEVSNFAQSGYESTQNAIYWNGENYLGLGLGAHSHIDSVRWGNLRRWFEYRDSIDLDRLPRSFTEILGDAEKREERLMIQLRLRSGVDVEDYFDSFGIDLLKVCEEEIQLLRTSGHIETMRNRLRLTPKGMLLTDEITAGFAGRLSD